MIKPKPYDMPALYSDFPLIGSHAFIYPGIINSHIFYPNEERSSIILQDKCANHSKLNWDLLIESTSLFSTFLDEAVKR